MPLRSIFGREIAWITESRGKEKNIFAVLAWNLMTCNLETTNLHVKVQLALL